MAESKIWASAGSQIPIFCTGGEFTSHRRRREEMSQYEYLFEDKLIPNHAVTQRQINKYQKGSLTAVEKVGK